MDGIPPVFIPSWQAQRETEEPHLIEEGEGADHVLIEKEQGEEAGHENHQGNGEEQGGEDLARSSSISEKEASAINASSESMPKRPFHVNIELNDKMFIWEGAAWKLKVDALLINMNESLTDRHGMNKEIFELGGPEVLSDCQSHGRCRTGAAVITRAGLLPCNRIIHAVSPKYSDRYHIAAENALHQCYRAVLRLAMERKLRTLAIACLYPSRKKYPPLEAAHVALRTVRRFLEHYPDHFDKIIFCFRPEEERVEQLLFNQVARCYWPRDEGEQDWGLRHMLKDRDVGNEWGEKVIEERKIRVSSVSGWPRGPQGCNRVGMGCRSISDDREGVSGGGDRSRRKSRRREDGDGGGSSDDEDEENSDEDRQEEEKKVKSLQIQPPPTPSYLEMVDDHDAKRREQVRGWFKSMTPEAREEYRYKSYIEQSRKEDLRDMEALGLIYIAGKDNANRDVVVIEARRFFHKLASAFTKSTSSSSSHPPSPPAAAADSTTTAAGGSGSSHSNGDSPSSPQDAAAAPTARGVAAAASLSPAAAAAGRTVSISSSFPSAGVAHVVIPPLAAAAVGKEGRVKEARGIKSTRNYRRRHGSAVKTEKEEEEDSDEEGEEDEEEEEEGQEGWRLDADRLLLWIVRVLEKVSKLPYSIVYLHSDLPPQAQPPADWVKEVVHLISKRYSQNLRSILVLEASWFVKVQLWALSFSAKNAWSKLGYLDNLTQLEDLMDPESLSVDPAVWEGIRERWAMREERSSSTSSSSASPSFSSAAGYQHHHRPPQNRDITLSTGHFYEGGSSSAALFPLPPSSSSSTWRHHRRHALSPTSRAPIVYTRVGSSRRMNSGLMRGAPRSTPITFNEL